MEEQYENLQKWVSERRLVRLVYVVEGLGPSVVYGQLLQFDEKNQNILLYNVDDKQVLSIRIREIDNIEPSSGVAS